MALRGTYEPIEEENGEEELEVGDASMMMQANPILETQAKHEIQSAIIVAKKYPRNEDQIYQKFVYGSCKRLGFALTAEYQFKRGRIKNDEDKWVDNIIKGPTVKFVRELARLWQNVRYGSIPIGESDEKRQILSYAWDLENNVWIQQGDLITKLVEKKVDGKTDWLPPDERELRELTNRRASIGIRNCLSQIISADFIDDGVQQCHDVIKVSMKDKDSAQFQDIKKRIIGGFSTINVPIIELEQLIGHPLASCDPNELEKLRGIFVAIKDGHTTWASYRKAEAEEQGSGLPTDIRRPTAPPITPSQTNGATSQPSTNASSRQASEQ